MSHTPGPWTLGKGDQTARDHAVCAGPIIIAKVNGNGYPIGEGWSPESAANARLMAAAPELLEALKSVVCSGGTKGFSDNHPKCIAIYAAIAKAEGAP